MPEPRGHFGRAATLITNPVLYVAWTILVLVMLTASYFGDPYVFGFTTFGLAGLSMVIALAGLSVVVLSRTTPGPAKVSIVVCVTVAAIALMVALQLVQAINWA